MPDWEAHLRPRLASLRLSPIRESEIVEELSQHLEIVRSSRSASDEKSRDRGARLGATVTYPWPASALGLSTTSHGSASRWRLF
jgi:hypothetical protein